MKNRKTEVKWALLFSAMYLLWMLLERWAGLHDRHLAQQQVVSTLILIPAVVIYTLALLDKKRNVYSGNITYRQSFLSGWTLSVFIVILTPVNQWITHYLITPHYFDNMTRYTVQTGILTKEQAEQQFNMGSFLVTGIIAGLITGVIFSAIISFFIKSKKEYA